MSVKAEKWYERIPYPEVGTKWDGEIRALVGHKAQRWGRTQRTFTVLAVGGGYVFAQTRGMEPLSVHISQWNERFTPREPQQKRAA